MIRKRCPLFTLSQQGGESHRIGGVQTYSYDPWPACDQARHRAAQQLWLARHNLTVVSELASAFFDTYLFHYDDQGD